jgi:hypothetical protein
MGLWRSKAQNILWVFKCRWCRRINISRKKNTTNKKRERAGGKKISIKKHKFISSSTWGLAS